MCFTYLHCSSEQHPAPTEGKTPMPMGLCPPTPCSSPGSFPFFLFRRALPIPSPSASPPRGGACSSDSVAVAVAVADVISNPLSCSRPSSATYSSTEALSWGATRYLACFATSYRVATAASGRLPSSPPSTQWRENVHVRRAGGYWVAFDISTSRSRSSCLKLIQSELLRIEIMA
jgi:hypothetical protein